MPQPNQWAILLCRYSDDPNDPSVTTVRDLGNQLTPAPPASAPEWITSSWATDTTTLLNKYQLFFSSTGAHTSNMPNFFKTVSHNKIDLSNTRVFACVLNRTRAEAASLANGVNTGGATYQNGTFHLAKQAFQQQWNIDPATFYAIVVSFQWPDFGSQGGPYDGGRGVFMDFRYVVNNGSKRWGHEMGHAFGLDHSRADSSDPTFNPFPCGNPPIAGDPSATDYRDPWDTMSAECSFGAEDLDYGAKGPAYNAWNMRGRGWLDETRVWHCPQEIFSQVLTLRPLHRLDLPGFLAAEIPPLNDLAGFPRYLVEFRMRADWDAGIPSSCVIVHRESGPIGSFLGNHSYIEFAQGARPVMGPGDIFFNGPGGGPYSQVRVLQIDEQNELARIHVSYLPDFTSICAARNQDGRIEVFCVAADSSIHHFWQVAPNTTWTSEFPKIGLNNLAKYITMILNGSNELEIIYVGTDNHIYHNWQTAANGNWHGEVRISDNDSAIQIAAGNNQNGQLQIFYRGTNSLLYYNVKEANGSWAGEKKLGDLVQQVAVGVNANSTFELCYTSPDGQLWRRRQGIQNNFDLWSPPISMQDKALQFAIASCDDEQLEMVYVNATQQLWHMFQLTPNGDWGAPQMLLPFAKNLALAKNSSGVLEMFFTDTNDVLFHFQQIEAHVWEQAPRRFMAAAKQPLLIANQDRHLELIYLGTDNALYHNWQLGSSNNWFGETPF
jgi:hypothetical protein